MTIREILANLSAAQQAFHRSSIAFDQAMAGLRDTLDAVARANHAQGEAIDAVVAATAQALQLYQADEQ